MQGNGSRSSDRIHDDASMSSNTVLPLANPLDTEFPIPSMLCRPVIHISGDMLTTDRQYLCRSHRMHHVGIGRAASQVRSKHLLARSTIHDVSQAGCRRAF